MVDLVEATSHLNRIDWNFPGSGTSARSIHTAHWFPGNFIAQIPAALIQILSKPNDLVLDPFGGSGTTGMEAWRLQRRSIVSDRLSSCLLIMRGKIAFGTTIIGDSTLRRLIDDLTWEQTCRSSALGATGEGGASGLSDWFSANTLSQLHYLWQLIEGQEGDVRAQLVLVFSDVLFACASVERATTASGGVRRHHWGWVADNVRPQPKDLVDHNAIAAFRGRLEILVGLERGLAKEFTPQLLCQDARRLSVRSESVDLVVTSPPYVGVIDYALASRLLYMWMNWPLLEERADEIGARYRRKRLTLVSEYLVDMDQSWSEIERVLKPGGYCAVVIGESRKFPNSVEAAMTRLEQRLPLVWGPYSRVPTRRRVSDRGATPAAEHIYVHQKPC